MCWCLRICFQPSRMSFRGNSFALEAISTFLIFCNPGRSAIGRHVVALQSRSISISHGYLCTALAGARIDFSAVSSYSPGTLSRWYFLGSVGMLFFSITLLCCWLRYLSFCDRSQLTWLRRYDFFSRRAPSRQSHHSKFDFRDCGWRSSMASSFPAVYAFVLGLEC